MNIRNKISLSISKKILYAFFIASFIPIIGLTYLSSQYFSTVVEEDTYSSLKKFAKSYGLVTYERIISFSDSLAKVSINADGEITDNIAQIFDEINVLKYKNISDAGFDESLKPRFEYFNSDNKIYFLINQLHERIDNSVYVLSGRFSMESLLSDSSDNPFNESMCIFSESGSIIFCSDNVGLDNEALIHVTNLIGVNNEIVEHSFHGDDFILVPWALFLPSQFQSESWNFVVIKQQNIALASIRKFEGFIIPIAIVFFLMMSLFVYRFVKKSFSPLSKLISATNVISAGNYNINIDIDTRDEFQELSTSFNNMSSSLLFQKKKDEVLSGLEKSTLLTSNIHLSIKENISQLTHLLDAKWLAVSIIDPINKGLMDSHCYQASVNNQEYFNYTHIEHDTFSSCLNDYSLNSIDKQTFKAEFQPVASGLHSDLIWTYAITVKKETIAYLFFSANSSHSLSNECTTALLEFSERFSTVYNTHSQRRTLYMRANYDSLTGLPNRDHTLDQLNSMWSNPRLKENPIAIIYVDLDNFKSVNDLSGHDAGNDVLSQVAQRLNSSVNNSAFVSRLSGDEFCILIDDVSSKQDISLMAKKIIENFKAPFCYKDMSFFLGVSIGIAIKSENDSSPSTLIEKADLAMFKAKQDGKNRYVLFNDEIERERNYRLSLEQYLHYALNNNEISLCYQPKVDLVTGNLVSAECLARWNQSDLGFIPTDQFISLAEESGMIQEIGEWILRKSCHQFVDWINKGLQLQSIAVNVSAKQIASNRMSEIVASAIEETGIPPHCLDLEITESAFINDPSLLTRELEKLHELGVKVSIDDFGKEYSSLSYLKKIPFDTLKIDREFIIDLESDHRDQHIVDVVISIGHTLNKKIVAEGIETTHQRDILINLGCDIGQGYLFSKPLSEIEFLEYAVNNNSVSLDIDINSNSSSSLVTK